MKCSDAIEETASLSRMDRYAKGAKIIKLGAIYMMCGDEPHPLKLVLD